MIISNSCSAQRTILYTLWSSYIITRIWVKTNICLRRLFAPLWRTWHLFVWKSNMRFIFKILRTAWKLVLINFWRFYDLFVMWIKGWMMRSYHIWFSHLLNFLLFSLFSFAFSWLLYSLFEGYSTGIILKLYFAFCFKKESFSCSLILFYNRLYSALTSYN